MAKDDSIILETDIPDTRTQKITLYFKNGKFHWSATSCGFDSLADTYNDIKTFFKIEEDEAINDCCINGACNLFK